MGLDRASAGTTGAGQAAGRAPVSARFVARIAWSIAVVAAVSEVFALVLMVLNSFYPEAETTPYWGAAVVIGVVFPVVGALIVSRYPGNALGWVFCVMGLTGGISDFASEYATYALIAYPGSLPGGMAAVWVGSVLGNTGFALLSLIPLLFPDGHLPSRRWRPVAWLLAAMIALAMLQFAFAPGPFNDFPSVSNPLGIESARPLFELISTIMSLGIFPLLFAGLAAIVVRFRRSRGDERQQLKWFTYAVFLIPISLVGNDLFPDYAWLIGGISVALLPVAIGIAVLKHRLYDIDIVINRTLVYGALTACVVGIYVLAVGYLGATFRAEGSLLVSLVATGIVAVVFAPLRDRVQRVVNRLMYGERDDPYAVLSRLGRRLDAALAPNDVLPAIVETVAGALKLPYAAVTLKRGDGFETAAAHGTPVNEPLVLPLTYGPEMVGQLVLGHRAAGESFGKQDLDLLDDLARQVGVAAHAVRLTADLQRSRERLVMAREEERRRLRRDLHDGIGPQLAALTLKLETARNKLSQDPTADALLSDLAERARVAVADVRRSVHALRPPALDELGLVPALRETAAQYSQNGLRVSVEAPENLPPLPAAVEVAAYHIAQEAMTNVVRHAGARNCAVRFGLDETSGLLSLEVQDDGRGLDGERGSGVGLFSMRERAEELGGTCAVEPLSAGGTRVLARLPCSTGREPTKSHRREE